MSTVDDKLKRYQYSERDQGSGRYVKSVLCDGCNKPCGTNYFTDDEVCQGGDGPGFYLCDRKRCRKALDGKSVAEREVHYKATYAARK